MPQTTLLILYHLYGLNSHTKLSISVHWNFILPVALAKTLEFSFSAFLYPISNPSANFAQSTCRVCPQTSLVLPPLIYKTHTIPVCTSQIILLTSHIYLSSLLDCILKTETRVILFAHKSLPKVLQQFLISTRVKASPTMA